MSVDELFKKKKITGSLRHGTVLLFLVVEEGNFLSILVMWRERSGNQNESTVVTWGDVRD